MELMDVVVLVPPAARKTKLLFPVTFQDVHVMCKILKQPHPANKPPHCLKVVLSSSSSSPQSQP